VLREGNDNGSESLTGTWIILLPRRVCMVLDSYKSAFGLESLIFGIEGWYWWWYDTARRLKRVIYGAINLRSLKPDCRYKYYHTHEC
jgi:hypothetical protein